jgi:ABC-2 type transport system permease protein
MTAERDRHDIPVRILRAGRWRWQRIVAVMRLESLQLWRDRPTLGLIALVPAVQVLLFGGAVNLNPTSLRLVIGHAAGVSTTQALRAAQATGNFRRIDILTIPGAARAAAVSGKAEISLELRADSPPTLAADATDAAAVRPAVLALALELQRAAAADMAGALGLPEAKGIARRVTPAVEWLHNEQASTSWSLMPGLAGVVMMISMLLLGALTLVREREQGHWESLLATAADGTDALIGKLAPYAVLGLVQALVVIACAHAIFAVPLRGSLLAFGAASLLFAIAHLLLGFALSALAATQLQAIQSAVFFYLPSMLLSGFMFPFQGMPRWAQWLGECLPLTHFVRIARGIMLRGADGAAALTPELWPIAAFAIAATIVALLCYRRHLQ